VNKREILEKLVSGKITLDEAEKAFETNHIEEVKDLANYDLFREKRTGIPEVVYSETKTPEVLVEIVKRVLKKKPIILLSRLKEAHVEALQIFNDDYALEFGTNKLFCRIKHKDYVLDHSKGKIGIVTAGTSDLPVAEESKAIAEMMGCEVHLVADVGVAGIHRLFDPLKNLLEKKVDAIVVAAGMEGALPTVITGLVDVPVIGLPISTGYGFGGKGQTALMSMLQSCALGLAVVNIDNGIGAGAIAAKIAIHSNQKCNCKNH